MPFNFELDFMVFQISYNIDEIPSSQMISNEQILEFMWPGNKLIIDYRRFHKHIIAYDKFLFFPDEPHWFRIDPKKFLFRPQKFCSDSKISLVPFPLEKKPFPGIFQTLVKIPGKLMERSKWKSLKVVGKSRNITVVGYIEKLESFMLEISSWKIMR